MRSIAPPWSVSVQRQAQIFMLLMSFFLVLIMSGLMTAILSGVDHDFLPRWLQRFVLAWPMVAGLILLLAPLVRRLMHRLFRFTDNFLPA